MRFSLTLAVSAACVLLPCSDASTPADHLNPAEIADYLWRDALKDLDSQPSSPDFKSSPASGPFRFIKLLDVVEQAHSLPPTNGTLEPVLVHPLPEGALNWTYSDVVASEIAAAKAEGPSAVDKSLTKGANNSENSNDGLGLSLGINLSLPVLGAAQAATFYSMQMYRALGDHPAALMDDTGVYGLSQAELVMRAASMYGYPQVLTPLAARQWMDAMLPEARSIPELAPGSKALIGGTLQSVLDAIDNFEPSESKGAPLQFASSHNLSKGVVAKRTDRFSNPPSEVSGEGVPAAWYGETREYTSLSEAENLLSDLRLPEPVKEILKDIATPMRGLNYDWPKLAQTLQQMARVALRNGAELDPKHVAALDEVISVSSHTFALNNLAHSYIGGITQSIRHFEPYVDSRDRLYKEIINVGREDIATLVKDIYVATWETLQGNPNVPWDVLREKAYTLADAQIPTDPLGHGSTAESILEVLDKLYEPAHTLLIDQDKWIKQPGAKEAEENAKKDPEVRSREIHEDLALSPFKNGASHQLMTDGAEFYDDIPAEEAINDYQYGLEVNPELHGMIVGRLNRYLQGELKKQKEENENVRQENEEIQRANEWARQQQQLHKAPPTVNEKPLKEPRNLCDPGSWVRKFRAKLRKLFGKEKTKTDTEEPQPSASVRPTQQPTWTNEPTPTNDPTPTKATQSQEPSQTREPSKTQTPSQTRAPSQTQTPSQTREPSSTQEPSPINEPTPDPTSHDEPENDSSSEDSSSKDSDSESSNSEDPNPKESNSEGSNPEDSNSKGSDSKGSSSNDSSSEGSSSEDSDSEDSSSEGSNSEGSSSEGSSSEDSNPEDPGPEGSSSEGSGPEDSGPEDSGPEDSVPNRSQPKDKHPNPKLPSLPKPKLPGSHKPKLPKVLSPSSIPILPPVDDDRSKSEADDSSFGHRNPMASPVIVTPSIVHVTSEVNTRQSPKPAQTPVVAPTTSKTATTQTYAPVTIPVTSKTSTTETTQTSAITAVTNEVTTTQSAEPSKTPTLAVALSTFRTVTRSATPVFQSTITPTATLPHTPIVIAPIATTTNSTSVETTPTSPTPTVLAPFQSPWHSITTITTTATTTTTTTTAATTTTATTTPTPTPTPSATPPSSSTPAQRHSTITPAPSYNRTAAVANTPTGIQNPASASDMPYSFRGPVTMARGWW